MSHKARMQAFKAEKRAQRRARRSEQRGERPVMSSTPSPGATKTGGRTLAAMEESLFPGIGARRAKTAGSKVLSHLASFRLRRG